MSSVVIILIGFLFSALFSGVETGSYMVNRIRLQRRVREKRRLALALSKLLNKPYLFIFTVLIGNNIAVYTVSMEVTNLYLAAGMDAGQVILGFIPWNAEMAATLSLMFPLFLFAEVGPKNLFRKKADMLMYRLSGFMQMLVLLFLPFTWPMRQFFRLLTNDSQNESVRDLHRLSPDALREYFSAGEKDGVISSHQNRMLDNVTSMHRLPVREVMTPFHDIARLEDTATVADFKRLLSKRNTTYAILMHKHQAVGLISMFSIVNRQLTDDDMLKPYAADVLSIEDNRNVKSAFYRLRRNPHHSAVIVDARKHPVGLVQMEDVARYIVTS